MTAGQERSYDDGAASWTRAYAEPASAFRAWTQRDFEPTRELSALGYRRSEPVEVEVEHPQLLSAVLQVHRGEHGYTDADLARLGGVAPRVLSALLPKHFRPAKAPHLHVVSRHRQSSVRLAYES